MAQDYGIKISNPTYDVNKSADYQLLFNSSWPSISIAYQTTISFPYTGRAIYGDITIPHNLKFTPFTQAWLYVNGQMIFEFYTGANSFASDGGGSTTYIMVDNTNAYPVYSFTVDSNYSPARDPFGNPMDGSLTAQIHIKCYNIDLTKQQNYVSPKQPLANAPYDKNFGIKLAKNGKSVNSNDLRDFILHTRGQTPAMLAVLTEASGVPDPGGSGGTLISYTNPRYTGWFFGWQGTTTPAGLSGYQSVPIQIPQAGSAGASIVNNNTYQLVVFGKGTMVVLRDPLFVPKNVTVSY